MRYKLWVIGLVSLALVGCSHHEKSTREQAPLRVRTMVVSPKSSIPTGRYVGTIEPVREIPLSLQSTGRVVAVSVKNGQRVRKGQVLLQIDNTQAKNALQGAEASYKHAKDGYDRVYQVHDKGVVSDQKMVEIESQLTQAKALYEAAKQQLNECTLFAPSDGIVNGLNVEIGQTIVPGTRLCTLLDMSGFCVRFTVPEAEIGFLQHIGAEYKGEVECVALNKVLPIELTELSMVANALTHTYDVKARIAGYDKRLMAGMVGKVTVHSESAEAKGEGIVIPARCVLLKPEGPTVWLKQGNQAVRRAITIGGYLADGVQVKEGLQAGDTLIIDGYQKLYTGCRVENE
ncbi:MAG: efflux RND transporter periplasmic adaptor subunit [Paludibacteraceae bacterium]|nr:efflux RND transporter periplasmic adaptor subunit [Paludibacteraceae bacterium]